MACAKCQAHRTAIKTAVKSGDVGRTVDEAGKALKTINAKLRARFIK